MQLKASQWTGRKPRPGKPTWRDQGYDEPFYILVDFFRFQKLKKRFNTFDSLESIFSNSSNAIFKIEISISFWIINIFIEFLT